MGTKETVAEIAGQLGLGKLNPGALGSGITAGSGSQLRSCSPIDEQELGVISCATEAEYDRLIIAATAAAKTWRNVPAPVRGSIVREIGEEFRAKKVALGTLVSIETGKILAEGLGEIQEAIDIAEFAVGLSRQLYGLSMHSERPQHRMYEQWHPLGVVGVITAFNFPAAVWAWNAMIAAVCGDVIVWKPSELAPLTAIAMHKIAAAVAEKHGHPGVFGLAIGDGPALGQKMAADTRIPLISATGSTRMGRSVGEVVAKRFGKSLLELGGNNAVIVLDDADLKLCIPSTLFGAVGTAGQRCTTTRRILVQKGIQQEFTAKLVDAYKQVRIGNPLAPTTLMGPLISNQAVQNYSQALIQAQEQGGKLLYGGHVLSNMPSSRYVEPTIVQATRGMQVVSEETFAPILYVITVDSLDQAIEANNEVPQGLSSAIFTRSIQSAERFLSVCGSDCGIANVNIGTSGAEIGGAFGGEKETGGGRESGSDSWKQYMRRQTSTINYSDALPLAQGIKFEL